jgi:tRNA A58 N-methylase Trm61
LFSSGKCLDVGFGSGYLSLAMRLLMKKIPNAVLFGIDHVRDFIVMAEENIEK